MCFRVIVGLQPVKMTGRSAVNLAQLTIELYGYKERELCPGKPALYLMLMELIWRQKVG